MYWGTKDVFKLFNSERFIFMDPEDPEPALKRLERLNSDPMAYKAAVEQPILAGGAKEAFSPLQKALEAANLPVPFKNGPMSRRE